MTYIDGIKEEATHFTLGSALHSVAELSGKWCEKKTTESAYKMWLGAQDIEDAPEEFDPKHFGIQKFKMIRQAADIGDYDIYGMPDEASFNKIVDSVLNDMFITDGALIDEIRLFSRIFFYTNNFESFPGESSSFELKFGMTKDWLPTKYDAKDVFFRGVIDRIDFRGGEIRITDYKSSRTKMSKDQFRKDYQFRVYAVFASRIFDMTKVESIKIVIKYLRFATEDVYEILPSEVEGLVEDVRGWVKRIADKAEEAIVTGGFSPKRNEYCGNCYAQTSCKLFIKNQSGPLNITVVDEESCVAAWKRIEADKAEVKALTSQVKSFASKREITIDEVAILGTHNKRERKIDSIACFGILMERGVGVMDILSRLQIKEKDFKDLYALPAGEDVKMSRAMKKEAAGLIPVVMKDKNVFDALTSVEIEKLAYGGEEDDDVE